MPVIGFGVWLQIEEAKKQLSLGQFFTLIHGVVHPA